ncbi:MAG: alpha/beta hydrolase [Flavobacteriia bacterium]|nr:MAG: alpha/beta hydrolase [Flavobacteriia bacterium]
MQPTLKTEGKFSYWESGEGQPIIVLHGLMGDLSNFDAVFKYFPTHGYKVIIPKLPIYTLSILKTNVKNLANFVKSFLDYKQMKDVVLLGNSLGGHIALLFSKLHLDYVKALVLTGSSGLYEKSMGSSYPKRGNREYLRKKVEEVFYDPAMATDELIDNIMVDVNDRHKLIRTLSLAKSAIRHNMADDLPNMDVPACVIWGKNDLVTPPEVAEDFHRLLPDSDLYWVDKCGHAAMMEHPEEFNEILHDWFKSRSI